MRRALLILLTLFTLEGVAFGQLVSGKKATFGSSPTPPDASTSVRITDLATSGSGSPLFTDSDGDVFRRLLAKTDLPSETAYKDEANTWALLQTFTSGLTSNGTALLNGTTTHGSITQGSGFASRTTAWGITASGVADFRDVFADGMHVRRFISDLEEAHNGSEIWSKSTAIVASTFTCPAAGGTATLTVEDLPSAADTRVFSANDWVVLKNFSRSDSDSDGATSLDVSTCVGQVSSYTDGSGVQSWTFTRGTSTNAGTMTASTTVAAKSLVINYGASGAGWAEVVGADSSEGELSPFFQVATWATSPIPANTTVRMRCGQLNGSYGYSASTWGCGFGDPSDENITIDSSNGIRIRQGSTNRAVLSGGSFTLYKSTGAAAVTLDNAGNATFSGDGNGVTNISGGNIQTGTITATQIAANTITSDKLFVTAGGANRVVNSSFEDSTDTKWALYNGGGGTVTSSGRNCTAAADGSCGWQVTWTGTSNTIKGVLATSGAVKGGWKPGQTYVISWYGWTTSSSTTVQMQLGWNTAPASSTALRNPFLNSAPQRYAYRVTMGSSVEPSGAIFIGHTFGASMAAGTLWIDAIKVEEGDTLGGYAPAPEEILPGTITADRLSVSNLQAIHADTGSLNVTGTLTVGTSGKLQSGKTSYGSGTGWLMEYNSGSPRFDIGSTSRYMRWTGSDVNIRGDNFEITSSGITVGPVGMNSTGFYTDYVDIRDAGIALTSGNGKLCFGGINTEPCVKDNSSGTAVRIQRLDTDNLLIEDTITTAGGAGQTHTITVRDSAGTGTCTLTFTDGIKTGGTCS